MEKYTERGIVLLKRETKELSDGIHALIEEKAILEEEIKKTRNQRDEALERKRSSFRDFDDMVASYFQKLRQEEWKLVEHIRQLKEDSSKWIGIVGLLKKDVASIEVPEPDFSFAEQMAGLLSEKINGLDSTRVSKETENDVLNQSLTKIAQEVLDLTKEKETLEPRLEHLRSEIFLGNDKNGRMGMEYLKLQDNITSIRNRERNILFMQKKLLSNPI